MLTQYGGGIEHLMSLPFEDGFDVIAAAEKRCGDSRLHEQIESFDNKKPLRNKQKSKDEIMNTVNNIIRATVG